MPLTRIPRRWIVALSAVCALTCVLSGCTKLDKKPVAKVAEVEVAFPIVESVTDEEEFTGHVESREVVLLRSRVTGYLDKVHFIDGQIVKEGQLLFEIDPRPYEAELAKAEANITQAKARYNRLQLDFERAQDLVAKKVIAKEEYDRVGGDRLEAEAAVGVAVAVRATAKLNLDYTKIKAPMAGRISRRYIDEGNLVKADDTVLTSIGDQNLYYAYFDIDERTVLKFTRSVAQGTSKPLWDVPIPVRVALADEDQPSHAGEIKFADNHIESGTGTLRVRAEVPNDHGVLAPGMFVRVVVPLGASRQGILVYEEAIGTDQGEKFLYVVVNKEIKRKNADGVEETVLADVIEKRRVEVGQARNGYREILKGVTTSDRVVVRGLQRVRPKAEVKATAAKDLPAYKPANGTETATKKPAPSR